MHDAHVRLVGEAVAQEGDQAVVQLDGDHPAGLLGDQLGEHAGTGADFEDGVVPRQLGRGDDAGAVGGVNEKVLAQALLGADAEGGELGEEGAGSRVSTRRGWRPAAGSPRAKPPSLRGWPLRSPPSQDRSS